MADGATPSQFSLAVGTDKYLQLNDVAMTQRSSPGDVSADDAPRGMEFRYEMHQPSGR